MESKRRRIPMMAQMESALADIGGDPLQGSGFEDEAPEEGFSDSEPVAPEPLQPRVL
jgi:hypothetical protein